MVGLSAELQERLKKAEEGQAIIIGNEHRPCHCYDIGEVVNIVFFDDDGTADCVSGDNTGQWVNLKDMIIKGK